jgi:hypothetical protein
MASYHEQLPCILVASAGVILRLISSFRLNLQFQILCVLLHLATACFRAQGPTNLIAFHLDSCATSEEGADMSYSGGPAAADEKPIIPTHEVPKLSSHGLKLVRLSLYIYRGIN